MTAEPTTNQQSAVRYEQDADGIVTLTLDDPTASANTMNELYRTSMHAAVDRLYDERAPSPGVVVTSAKKTFFAGGDLAAMMQATPDDAPAIFAELEAMKADLRRLEKLPHPVVAAINGAALGGGYEIALACHHRIVVDDPSAVVGLPEATLGLLPGGGGVTRVTRMFGLQTALMDVLLQGTRFKPAEARAKGLVDEVVATRDDLVAAAKAWILGRTPTVPPTRGTARATGCREAPRSRPSWRRSCRRSPRCCDSRPRGRSIPRSGPSCPRPSRAQASTSTPPAGSRAATSRTSSSVRTSRT